MKHYSAVNHENMSFARKWILSEINMLRKIIQIQEDNYCMFSYIWNVDLSKNGHKEEFYYSLFNWALWFFCDSFI
jgi:hypothetical protein